MIDLFCGPPGREDKTLNNSTLDVTPPKQNPTPNSRKSAELIADALKELSMEDRERVFHDVHGVSPVMEETKEFVEQKFQEMEMHLQKLKTGSFWNLQLAGFEMAESQDLAYVESSRFRLKFLRAEKFDPSEAAARLVRYFDWKLELFGEDKLCRDIGIHDLDRVDVEMLRKGYVQRLPVRDRAGRAVFIAIYNGQVYRSRFSMGRIHFYLCNCDEETERKGAVFLGLKVKEYRFEEVDLPNDAVVFKRIGSDLPVRFSAAHKFLDTNCPNMMKMEAFVVSALNDFAPPFRARINMHYGSHTEWIYDIMTLGVPHHLIPFTPSYKIKTKNHLELLAMMKRAEEIARSGNSVETIDLPNNHDVLLGKGKPIQESPGNCKLLGLVDSHVAQYQSSSKTDKTTLATEIVQKVKKTGGRFLSRDCGVWIEVADEIARDKVSHMFRHQKLKVSQKTCREMTGNQSTIRIPEVPTASLAAVEQPHGKRIRV